LTLTPSQNTMNDVRLAGPWVFAVTAD